MNATTGDVAIKRLPYIKQDYAPSNNAAIMLAGPGHHSLRFGTIDLPSIHISGRVI